MVYNVSANDSVIESDGHFCQNLKDGVYADIESDCHKFYVCEKTHEYKFSCPPSHRFVQRFESCSFVAPEEEHSFSCEEGHHINELKSQSMDHPRESHEEGHVHQIERRTDDVLIGSDSQAFDDRNFHVPKAMTDKSIDEYMKAVLGVSSYLGDVLPTDDVSGVQSSRHESSRSHFEEEIEPGFRPSRKQSLSAGCGRGMRNKRSCRSRL